MSRPELVDVEVIVPVHDLRRPIARTVQSLLAGGLGPEHVRITVVAHNLRSTALCSALTAAGLGDVATVRECLDGERSPAGPRAVGLAHANARFVSFVDSDDTLEPGALAAWLALAERDRLDAVIALERHASGGLVRNPLVRPWPRRTVHGVRDRLVYRTALRGLFSLDAVHAEQLAFTQGGTNGSDQPFTLKLWHSGRRIGLASRRPAYVLGDDAPTRVTQTVQPLATELAAPRALLDEPWFSRLSAAARTHAVTKIVRIHLLPQLAARLETEGADEALATARELLDRAAPVAPDYRRSLSRIDARIVAVLTSSVDVEALRPLLAVRRTFTHPRALLTPRLLDSLRRDAPLRLAAASVLLSLRAAPEAR